MEKEKVIIKIPVECKEDGDDVILSFKIEDLVIGIDSNFS